MPCLLAADASSRTASLIENVQREAMHPSDQFEAFAAQIAEGCSIEDITADFSVSPERIFLLGLPNEDICNRHRTIKP